ncbi:MAG: 4Fe-4S dicluster domain-containing protein, partial [Dehalococcoidia bacterium]
LLANFEYGDVRARQPDGNESPIGNARKCHFCIHRLEKGQLPACVTTCMGVANYFGDANDPTNLVSELIARPNAIQLKVEMGTDPNVHYLV